MEGGSFPPLGGNSPCGSTANQMWIAEECSSFRESTTLSNMHRMSTVAPKATHIDQGWWNDNQFSSCHCAILGANRGGGLLGDQGGPSITISPSRIIFSITPQSTVPLITFYFVIEYLSLPCLSSCVLTTFQYLNHHSLTLLSRFSKHIHSFQ